MTFLSESDWHARRAAHAERVRPWVDPGLRRMSLGEKHPAAQPLNKYQPGRDTTAEFEQPGCLHANMDLYKWAFKLSPFSSSGLVADCFALAREIRVLDMRASPYDFSALGLSPVCIETPEGRGEYEAGDFARRAAPLRRRLRDLCDAIFAASPAGEEVLS